MKDPFQFFYANSRSMAKLCTVRFFETCSVLTNTRERKRSRVSHTCMAITIFSAAFSWSPYFFSHLCWDAQHKNALFMDLWQIEKRYERYVVAVLCDGLVSLIFHCVVVVVETNRFSSFAHLFCFHRMMLPLEMRYTCRFSSVWRSKRSRLLFGRISEWMSECAQWDANRSITTDTKKAHCVGSAFYPLYLLEASFAFASVFPVFSDHLLILTACQYSFVKH